MRLLVFEGCVLELISSSRCRAAVSNQARLFSLPWPELSGRRVDPANVPVMSLRRREATRANPTLILAVLSVSALAYAVLSSAVIPALPTIQRSLHTSETGVAGF